ncbi:unnamed protein product [Didymodactylos carnosus]|uniref:Uncharacterized protein n=1 Tax=Didymodactylos carnosus TaxID=1234261 RepID=A0A815JUN9_9BILA|nr:unnamed protein product [Didymodactylos carnosus]CAF1384628.1 unnamed protein product [Didymodactylos carnosus]CAF3529739.1 unnamed protein product [Didymodactylos carnosus]CAF4279824.1 unnamed protein product [Didymodactylos carnosus]
MSLASSYRGIEELYSSDDDETELLKNFDYLHKQRLFRQRSSDGSGDNNFFENKVKQHIKTNKIDDKSRHHKQLLSRPQSNEYVNNENKVPMDTTNKHAVSDSDINSQKLFVENLKDTQSISTSSIHHLCYKFDKHILHYNSTGGLQDEKAIDIDLEWFKLVKGVKLVLSQVLLDKNYYNRLENEDKNQSIETDKKITSEFCTCKRGSTNRRNAICKQVDKFDFNGQLIYFHSVARNMIIDENLKAVGI